MTTPIRLASLLMMLAGSRLLAQDVTVLNPLWFRLEPQPEVMPKPSSRLNPDYPDELLKLDEIGYVALDRIVFGTGENLLNATQATHIPLRRAVEEEVRGWSLSAAKREGHPIDARVWLPVIFNPKSAAKRNPNATPRLLEVAPVLLPNIPAAAAGFSSLLRVRFSLDETGTIVSAEPETKVTRASGDALLAALKKWRFAPARQNGQPVAASVVVPVICQLPLRATESAVVQARAINREPVEYPRALRGSGLRGEVKVTCDIDTEGKVTGVVIESSNSPPFEAPALQAARKWTFHPATRDGKPIKTRQTIDYAFHPDGGEEAYRVDQHGDMSKLPPELRFDTPPKIRSVLVPVYPYALRRDGIEGAAKVTILIDRLGHVAAVKIRQADRPEFGLALAAALEGFAFDAALKDGKPVANLMNYEQKFDTLWLRNEAAARLLGLERKHPERIVELTALDTPLKPLSRRQPIFPHALMDTTKHGEALIEFIVDDDGGVQLPRAISASAEEFGFAAVQAVGTWLFEPPTVAGKPVVARGRIPFIFNLSPPPGAKAAPTPPKP